MNSGGKDILQIVTDQVVFKKYPTYFETACHQPDELPESLLWRGGRYTGPLGSRFNKAVQASAYGQLKRRQQITVLLKILVFTAFEKVMNAPEVLRLITEAVMNNRRVVALVASLVNSEQLRPTEK